MNLLNQSFPSLVSDIKEFHGLSSVDLGMAIQSFHQQHYAAGEEIVRYQDHNNSVFFVLKGVIRVLIMLYQAMKSFCVICQQEKCLVN